MTHKILFIGHGYHQITKSSAFFVEQLGLLGEVTTMADDCLNGEVNPHYLAAAEPFDLVVVWQLPQVILQLVKAGRHKNIVFVPMYDAVHTLDASFWQGLRHIKIICFSSTLEAICITHKLDSFFIRYYPEWVGLSPAGYCAKSLFFWQRRSWPNWQSVTSILPASQFERMHHHLAIDPGFEKILPGKTNRPISAEPRDGRLSSSVWFQDKSELLGKLGEFNVFFLPRKREGIGLSFLDAMKMGMILVGLDRATYNEYVVHGINGFIVNEKLEYLLPDLLPLAHASEHYFLKGRISYLRSLDGLRVFLARAVEVSNEAKRISPLQKGPVFLRRFINRFSAPSGVGRKRSLNARPLVSVIVTVRNDIEGFLATHRSVCEQSFEDFEYIVVDRNSSDGTRERVGRNLALIDQRIDQPEGTRIDAARHGAANASGRYLLVFNAGDKFTNRTALEDAMQIAPQDAAAIYGHSFAEEEGGAIRLKHAADLNETYQRINRGSAVEGTLHKLPSLASTLVAKEILLQDMKSSPAGHQGMLIAACSRGARMYHSNTVIATCGARPLVGKKKAALARDWSEIVLRHAFSTNERP